MQIGDAVQYTDEFGKPHAALLTAVHGGASDTPTVNVLYVSPDEKEHDQYGRQIRRQSSVAHGDMTTAHGRFYRPL